MNDPDAARAMAEVERLMDEGAAATKHRFPYWYIAVTCLLCVVGGGIYDIPGWGALLRLPLTIVLMVVWSFASRTAWRRAQPLPKAFGSTVMIAGFFGVLLLYVAATGFGIGLQSVGIPLPFTWAGLTFGIAILGLLHLGASRINDRYRKNIERGRW